MSHYFHDLKVFLLQLNSSLLLDATLTFPLRSTEPLSIMKLLHDICSLIQMLYLNVAIIPR